MNEALFTAGHLVPQLSDKEHELFEMYDSDSNVEEESAEPYARTQIEYMFEPLANLKGAADELIFLGVIKECKFFLEIHMDYLKESLLGRREKTDYSVYLN
jgi:hypothetical protein